jgi:hypothetical protein
VAHFRIEMISGGSLGRADQKGLHARIDHDPRFFVRVKVQRFHFCGPASRALIKKAKRLGRRAKASDRTTLSARSIGANVSAPCCTC